MVAATGEITTLAGNGTAGYTGNNGPATAAELNGPLGIAFDTEGDVFIADSNNNVIREIVKATGDIITVAGTGTAGYSGNNGPATAAELNYPGRIAVDPAGDLFIADRNNNRIREVGLAVTVTVGSSSALPTLTALTASTTSAVIGQPVTFTATVSDLSAGGAVPTGGTVTFSDQNGTLGSEPLVNGVAAFTASSSSTGTITVTASYGGTTGFAPSVTGTIVTAVGNGTAGYQGDNGPATAAELDNPWGVAVDSAGDLFIGDANNNVVREVVKLTGDIITVAGNGTAGYSGDNGLATDAELNHPAGVAVDSAGDVFVADLDNNVVREVVKATGDIITFAGNGTAGYSGDNGPATAAELDWPRGIDIDSAGDLFIADLVNNVVREVVKATGHIITVAGNGTAGYSGDGGPATAAELYTPSDVAVDSAGDLFIADWGNSVIREVVKATGDIITFAGNGKAGYSGDGGPATAAELAGDSGVAIDSAGDVFIADTAGNNVVREVVKATGDIITIAGNGTAGYSGDNGPATAAELDYEGRVAVDSAGDVFVTDSNNNVIREFTPAWTVAISQSAPADHFVVTTSFANPDVAGTPGTVTVTAEDPYGNIAGSGPDQYLGTVDLTSTDPQIAGLPTTYTFTLGDDGSHTFNVTLMTAGPQTITATDSVTSTITGTSPAIHVSAGHAVSLAIVKRPPGGIPAGSRFTVGVGAVEYLRQRRSDLQRPRDGGAGQRFGRQPGRYAHADGRRTVWPPSTTSPIPPAGRSRSPAPAAR